MAFICSTLILFKLLLVSGVEAATLVMVRVTDGLGGVEKQPENTGKYSGLDKGPATYGVVKALRDNDMDLHSNQQVGVS